MKAVILCGGLGTRLSEETDLKPKPMVEVGGLPVLWHIMKGYAAYGIREFVLALGYKGDVIKDFFLNYRHRSHSLSVHLADGRIDVHAGETEDWVIHLLNTGVDTQTGGRVRQAAEFIGNERFLLTYGDGVSNVDIGAVLAFHQAHGKLATVTAVRPPARFGTFVFDGDMVTRFDEKPQVGEGWINGGFFVLEPEVVRYVASNQAIWEREPMERLAVERQMMMYRHAGFWQCMDTLRDVRLLNGLWAGGKAPWKVWS
jgi:glucose-1-phosphate cytidylyltransferase